MVADITNNELCKHFVGLLKDTEAEVRTAAATKVTGVCIKMPVENSIKLVLPCVKELVSDTSQHARGMAHTSSMRVLVADSPIFAQLRWHQSLWAWRPSSAKKTP